MTVQNGRTARWRTGLPAAFVAFLSAILQACNPAISASPAISAQSLPPAQGYRVVSAYPHDAAAFTQGLEYADGFLYEGTGLNGRSSIRKVKLETGEVVERRDIPQEHFGEGVTIWKSDLIQLTWQSQVAFVYDTATFVPRRTFMYEGEGWGLTHDATQLIMSDGTDALRLLDPLTFAERRRITVTAGGVPLRDLNELEYVKGEIFANVWMTDNIARIALLTGRVTGYIDLRGLLSPAERAPVETAGGVLNGIAYDAEHDRLFVTGKLWPKLFEIKIVGR
jgi:glutamine cyclotransferase